MSRKLLEFDVRVSYTAPSIIEIRFFNIKRKVYVISGGGNVDLRERGIERERERERVY